MGADKVSLVQIFDNHHIGHGTHHGRISPRPDGHPLVGQAGRAQRVAWVDTHNTSPTLPRQLHKVVAVGSVAHLGRVPTPHQDEPGIQPILALVARMQGAIHRWRGDVDGGPAITVIDAQAAAKEVHQPAGCLRAIDLVVAARAIGHEQSAVAIGIFDALHFARHGIQGFVPRDALELALAAFPHPLHRVLEPVGMVLAPQIGPPARAGTQLRCRQRIRPVVSVEPGDDAPPAGVLLDVGHQQAAAAAIVGWAAHPNKAFRGTGLHARSGLLPTEPMH